MNPRKAMEKKVIQNEALALGQAGKKLPMKEQKLGCPRISLLHKGMPEDNTEF